MKTLREHIRQETGALHAILDKTPPALALTGAGATCDDACRFVKLTLGAERAIHPLLMAPDVREPLLDLLPAERDHAPVLERSLRAFGLDDAAIAALPALPNPPRLDTPAQALGVWYVREGASRGARRFAPRVRDRLGLSPEQAAGLMPYGDGPAVDARWEIFVQVLNRHSPDSAEGKEAVAAACAYFEALIPWFRAP